VVVEFGKCLRLTVVRRSFQDSAPTIIYRQWQNERLRAFGIAAWRSRFSALPFCIRCARCGTSRTSDGGTHVLLVDPVRRLLLPQIAAVSAQLTLCQFAAAFPFPRLRSNSDAARPFYQCFQEMFMEPAISCGIDIGHSMVKIVTRVRNLDGSVTTSQESFPTAVINAFDIRDKVELANSARDTVNIGGRRFFVGATAELHGEPETFLDDDWVVRPEYSALLRVALNRVEEYVEQALGPRVLVLGLPARLEGRQREALGEVAADLCPGWEVRIVPQSKAPYYAFAIDGRGRLKQNDAMMRQGCGVIDVGRYTTDCAAITGGRWSESSFSSDVGTKLAEDHLIWLLGRNGEVLSQAAAETAVRTGITLRKCKEVNLSNEVDEAVREFRKRVLEYARRNFSKSSSKISGIILAGGGAPLVHDAIGSVWANIVMLPDSRFSIADGMSKFGLAVDTRRVTTTTLPFAVAS